MPITENEILSRHSQALGDARDSCQQLGRNADPEYLAPRGHHYAELKRSLMALEGSCRQMAHYRSDARWLRLGIVYGRAMRGAQAKFVGQRWSWFKALMPLFENGMRSMTDLREMKTGRLTTSPILPTNPSKWLVLADHKPAMRGPGTVH